jgi:hypothetical protein
MARAVAITNLLDRSGTCRRDGRWCQGQGAGLWPPVAAESDEFWLQAPDGWASARQIPFVFRLRSQLPTTSLVGSAAWPNTGRGVHQTRDLPMPGVHAHER